MSDKANKGCDPGAKSKEKDNESGHDQLENKQTQSENEPEDFRSGKNICDHNE